MATRWWGRWSRRCGRSRTAGSAGWRLRTTFCGRSSEFCWAVNRNIGTDEEKGRRMKMMKAAVLAAAILGPLGAGAASITNYLFPVAWSLELNTNVLLEGQSADMTFRYYDSNVLDWGVGRE